MARKSKERRQLERAAAEAPRRTLVHQSCTDSLARGCAIVLCCDHCWNAFLGILET